MTQQSSIKITLGYYLLITMVITTSSFQIPPSHHHPISTRTIIPSSSFPVNKHYRMTPPLSYMSSSSISSSRNRNRSSSTYHPTNPFIHHRTSKLFLMKETNNHNNDNLPSSSSLDHPLSFKSESDPPTGSTSTSTSSPPASSSSSSSSSPNLNKKSIEQALLDAEKLKERAMKERLEAEQMSLQLTQNKIDLLELKLKKLGDKSIIMKEENKVDSDNDNNDDGGREVVDLKLIKESEDLKAQIENLKKQIDLITTGPTTTTTSTTTPTASSMSAQTSDKNGSTKQEEKGTTTTLTTKDIPKMPKDVFEKRCEAFKRFPADVKALYARAAGANENDTIDTIVEKVYLQEQLEKKKDTLSALDFEDEEASSISLLDIANAQAGYSTLPPPIQEMIRESVGLSGERNVTAVIEKLIERNKVKPTGDFGGVEFAMGDIDDDERGDAREFTPEEIEGAIGLFDNLPIPMKTMLASSVDMDSSNSTAIIEKMIQEGKILPSKDGVEFVVFGDENDDLVGNSMEMIEADNYIKSMLPPATRKDGNMPTEAEADAFFKEVLGRKTFNPISRPEAIPGGYIIRGENMMKSSDELVSAMEAALEKSTVAGKIQPYIIRDPTLVTDEQFDTNTFELPVVMITGPDLKPSTNRLVKPLVTLVGGVFVASFAVATCFANDAASQDPAWLEEMATPLIISIFLTQLAHEAAHQIVAFKDKFKTGAPTLVPSLQLGLTGCITPLKTPPPNFNSLFDFAIAGPLVGMIVSLGLMYAGLEQQVFMDAASQAQLPCLPVNVIRSSSLSGGMIEWLLGEGLLVAPDPTAVIRLHPLAIAGFVGIMSNALSLLPIGNTDGGRVSLSLFGRSVSRVVRTGTIGIIVFTSFFGGDPMNILLFYTIFAQIWQRESEIPCKNEVQNVDDIRGIFALVTGLMVALAVIPMI